MEPCEPLRLRQELPEDEEFLAQLYASGRAAEMARVPWDEAQKQAFLRSQFRLQTVHYRRHYADAAFQIVLGGDRAIGRIYVQRNPGHILVIDISLIPECRNRGIGGGLMRQILAEAQAEGKAVRLHVEMDNPAQRLYRRLGFQPIEEKVPYVLMEWRPGD